MSTPTLSSLLLLRSSSLREFTDRKADATIPQDSNESLQQLNL